MSVDRRVVQVGFSQGAGPPEKLERGDRWGSPWGRDPHEKLERRACGVLPGGGTP